MVVGLKVFCACNGQKDKFIDKREVKSSLRLVNYMFLGCE